MLVLMAIIEVTEPKPCLLGKRKAVPVVSEANMNGRQHQLLCQYEPDDWLFQLEVHVTQCW